MASGGYRPGAGRPKKAVAPKHEKPAKVDPVIQTPIELKAGEIEPLDYMLSVINDPDADQSRRDRMAIAAAPYRHARADDRIGKKEQRQEAADRANDKFAVQAAPRLVISNK